MDTTLTPIWSPCSALTPRELCLPCDRTFRGHKIEAILPLRSRKLQYFHTESTYSCLKPQAVSFFQQFLNIPTKKLLWTLVSVFIQRMLNKPRNLHQSLSPGIVESKPQPKLVRLKNPFTRMSRIASSNLNQSLCDYFSLEHTTFTKTNPEFIVDAQDSPTHPP